MLGCEDVNECNTIEDSICDAFFDSECLSKILNCKADFGKCGNPDNLTAPYVALEYNGESRRKRSSKKETIVHRYRLKLVYDRLCVVPEWDDLKCVKEDIAGGSIESIRVRVGRPTSARGGLKQILVVLEVRTEMSRECCK